MSIHRALVLAFALTLTLPALAQKQPASPPANAECKFADGKTIKVDYSSPRMKKRKIYGGLVPYGKSGAQARTMPPHS